MTKISYMQTPDSIYTEYSLWQKKDAPVVLDNLANRMKLSRKNGDKFFDSDSSWNDYYVWYSQDQMAERIHASPRKIFGIYKFLEQQDYIRRQTLGDKKPDEIFLTDTAKRLFPNLHKNCESGFAKHAKGDSKNSLRINNDKTNNHVEHDGGSSDLVNSGGDEKKKDDQHPQSEHDTEKQRAQVTKDAENLSSLKKPRLIHWVTKTHQGLGLTTNVLKNILKVANYSTSVARYIIKLIKNARSHITKAYHISFTDIKARFESNDNFDLPLADKILNIFNYVNKKGLQGKERGKYLMSCFKDFTLDALGIKAKQTHFTTKPDMEADYDTPLFSDGETYQGNKDIFNDIRKDDGKLPTLAELENN